MKVFSPLLDDPSHSPNPIVENALELLKSDAIKSVCQCLDEFVWVKKTLVLYGSLGSSEKSEAAWTEIRGIGWVIKSLKLHAANFLGCLLGIVYSAVIHVNLHVLRVPVSNAVMALFIDSFEYRVDELLLIIFLSPW
jgi:hypothetical protein